MLDIGSRIKARRKALDMSAERLADLIGVSPATIYRYESNDIAHMGVDKLSPIADALHVSPGDLMGWNDAPAEALSPGESELIALFRRLNDDGKSLVTATARMAAGNPDMQKENISSEMA